MNDIQKKVWGSELDIYAGFKAKNGKRNPKLLKAVVVGSVIMGSVVTGTALGAENVEIADGASATGTAAIAIGKNAQATKVESIAVGEEAKAEGESYVAIGKGAHIKPTAEVRIPSNPSGISSNAIAIGRDATAEGISAIALGTQATALENSVVIGVKATVGTTGFTSVAIGSSAESKGINAVATGGEAKANAKNSSALGQASQVLEGADSGTAVGDGATVYGKQGTAVGAGAKAGTLGDTTKASASAFGDAATAQGKAATALGSGAKATVDNATAVGNLANASGWVGLAVGYNSGASQERASAFGSEAKAEAKYALAMGYKSSAKGVDSIAIGSSSSATGISSISIGKGNVVKGNYSGAIGDPSIVNATNSYSVGNNNAIGGAGTDNAFVLGGQNSVGATATRDADGVIDTNQNLSDVANASRSAVVGYKNTVNSDKVMVLGNEVTVGTGKSGAVVLGDNSDGAVEVKAVNSVKVGLLAYSGFAGNLGNQATDGTVSSATDQGRFVSIGAQGNERQLKHVAAGEISATSTDAINGSQLNAVLGNIGNMASTTVNILGGNAAVAEDGSFSMTNIGGTGESTIHDAIAKVAAAADKNPTVLSGTNTTVTANANPAGYTEYTVNLNPKITLGTDADKTVVVDGTAGTITAGTGNNTVLIDGTKATISANGSDGASVVMNGKDGSIALTGSNGDNGMTIKGAQGAAGVDGASGDTKTRITYEYIKPDGTPSTETVATLNDGMKYGGDIGPAIKKKLNEQIDIKGGITDASKLTDNNIGVVADGSGVLMVKLGTDLTGLNSIATSSITADEYKVGNKVYINDSGINANDEKIVNVAPGEISSTSTDAINGSQIFGIADQINNIAQEVQDVGATSAALTALKPLQYDPLEPTQIMAGVGGYRGKHALAIGVAHYKNESTLFHAGVSVGTKNPMYNVGITWKIGSRAAEQAVPDRYRLGPISSVYAMQDEVSALKAENVQIKKENKQIREDNEMLRQDNREIKAKLDMLMQQLGIS